MGALVELHYRAGNRAHGSAWRGARESGGDGDADPDLSDIARAESDESILVGTDEHPFWSVDRNEWVLMGKLRVGERLSLADGSFATVISINFELSPRTTGRWQASSTGSGQANQPCTGTFGTSADPQTGLFPVYNLIVADWHTYFATGQGKPVLVHNGGPCAIERLRQMRREAKTPGTELYEIGRQLGQSNTHVQYALVADEAGLFPVMRRGYAEPVGQVWLEKGQAWRYGQTKNPGARYPQAWLKEAGLKFDEQYWSNQQGSLAAERARIDVQEAFEGCLPPGNKVRR